MEEIIVMMFKAAWGIIQAVYYLIRFIIQTIFFIRAKIPKSPEAYRFPEKARFEHTLVVGGSGHGKTQLLQHLFVCNDLNDVMAGKKSVVFIDSQGYAAKDSAFGRADTLTPSGSKTRAAAAEARGY